MHAQLRQLQLLTKILLLQVLQLILSIRPHVLPGQKGWRDSPPQVACTRQARRPRGMTSATSAGPRARAPAPACTMLMIIVIINEYGL